MNVAVREGRLVLRNGRVVVGECPECCGEPGGPCIGYFLAEACPVDRQGQPNACAYPEPPYSGLWFPCGSQCQNGSSLFNGANVPGWTFRYAGWCFTPVPVPDPTIGTPLEDIPVSTQFPILLDDRFDCVGAGCEGCDQFDDVYVQLQPCECTLAGQDTPKYVCAARVFDATNAGLCYVIVRESASGAMVCYHPQFLNIIYGEESLPPNATVYGRNGADGTEYEDCCACCDTWSANCDREHIAFGFDIPGYTDTTRWPLQCCCDSTQVTGTYSGTYDFNNPAFGFSERREGSGVCVGGVWTCQLRIIQNGVVQSDNVFLVDARCNPLNYGGAGGFGPGYFGITVGGRDPDGAGLGTFNATCGSLDVSGSFSRPTGITSATTFTLRQSFNANGCDSRCGQSVGGAGFRSRDKLLDDLETALKG